MKDISNYISALESQQFLRYGGFIVIEVVKNIVMYLYCEWNLFCSNFTCSGTVFLNTGLIQ
jgi:hypothetical protein